MTRNEEHEHEHEHECIWGPVEYARFTGNPHRRCQVCRMVTLDLSDEPDFEEGE